MGSVETSQKESHVRGTGFKPRDSVANGDIGGGFTNEISRKTVKGPTITPKGC